MSRLTPFSFLSTTVGVSVLLAAVSASANSITMEFSTGGTNVTLWTSTAASNTLAVDLYANFSAVGGGQIVVVTSLRASTGLTPVACKETLTQTIASGPTNVTWGRFTDNCGAGDPGDGGIRGREVVVIDQETKEPYPVSSSSGTIKMGTVTFHMVGTPGTFFINATYDPILDGFGAVDLVTRAPTFLGGVTVTLIPEPATVALLGSGLLGILGYNRRRRRP
jgi:hypothetical protein